MPRGVKGSGKSKKAAKTAKTRKPYPTHEERLIAVDADIERLTKLNEERVELVKKTEEKLAERKIALQRSEDMLLKAQAKREKIISVRIARRRSRGRQADSGGARRQAQRVVGEGAPRPKRLNAKNHNALLAAIEESGKSVR